MEKDYKKLYEAVSSKFNIGSYDEFISKMDTPDNRKKFYDAVGGKGFDLGNYKEYEGRLKKKEASQDSSESVQQPTEPSEKPLEEQEIPLSALDSKKEEPKELTLDDLITDEEVDTFRDTEKEVTEEDLRWSEEKQNLDRQIQSNIFTPEQKDEMTRYSINKQKEHENRDKVQFESDLKDAGKYVEASGIMSEIPSGTDDVELQNLSEDLSINFNHLKNLQKSLSEDNLISDLSNEEIKDFVSEYKATEAGILNSVLELQKARKESGNPYLGMNDEQKKNALAMERYNSVADQEQKEILKTVGYDKVQGLPKLELKEREATAKIMSGFDDYLGGLKDKDLDKWKNSLGKSKKELLKEYLNTEVYPKLKYDLRKHESSMLFGLFDKDNKFKDIVGEAEESSDLITQDVVFDDLKGALALMVAVQYDQNPMDYFAETGEAPSKAFTQENPLIGAIGETASDLGVKNVTDVLYEGVVGGTLGALLKGGEWVTGSEKQIDGLEMGLAVIDNTSLATNYANHLEEIGLNVPQDVKNLSEANRADKWVKSIQFTADLGVDFALTEALTAGVGGFAKGLGYGKKITNFYNKLNKIRKTGSKSQKLIIDGVFKGLEFAEQGARYEAVGYLFPDAGDEATFASGVAGEVGASIGEAMLNGLSKFPGFKKLKGDKLVKLTRFFTRGTGEIFEETAQTLQQIYSEGGDFGDVKEQFTGDNLVDFLAMTYLMGTAMGSSRNSTEAAKGKEMLDYVNSQKEGIPEEQATLLEKALGIDEIKEQVPEELKAKEEVSPIKEEVKTVEPVESEPISEVKEETEVVKEEIETAPVVEGVAEETIEEVPVVEDKELGYSSDDVVETDDAELYSSIMSESIKERGETKNDALQVTALSKEQAQEILDEGGKLFITKDNKAGAYVTSDGYMGGLFKSLSANKAQAAKALQEVRVKSGGKFFDAYGTHLEDIYIKNGFRPVARMKFDKEQAPKGWEKTNLKSKPDFVFFAYDPNGDYKKGDGALIEDYNKAYDLAKNFTQQDAAQTEPTLVKPDKQTAREKAKAKVKASREEAKLKAKDKAKGVSIKKQNISDIDKVKVTSEDQKKALGTVKNVVKALGKIAPEQEVVIHENEESYLEALGTSEAKGTSGALSPDGKIHLNMGSVQSNTALHEAAHVVVGSYLKSAKKDIGGVKSVLEKSLPESARKDLDKFTKEYESDGQETMDDEYVTEALSRIADGRIELDKSTLDKIINFLKELAKKVGLDSNQVKLTGKEDVKQFAQKVSEALREGKEINVIDGKIAKVTAKPKYSKVIDNLKVNEITTHENTKVVKGFDLNDIVGQNASSTLSDKLMTGVIGRYKLLGGIYYPKATGRIWAADSLGGANAIVNKMKPSKDGYKYLIPAIMSPISHMSNKTMASIGVSLLREADLNKEVNRAKLYNDIIAGFSRKDVVKKLPLVKKLMGSRPSKKKMFDALDYLMLSDELTFEERKKSMLSIIGESSVGKPKYPTVGTFSDLANSLAERRTKDLDIHQVTTVIRTKGEVKSVETPKSDEFYHESYAYHIESDQEIELLVLDGVYNLTDIIPEFETNEGNKYSTKDAIENRRADWDEKRAIRNLGRTHGLSSYSAEIAAAEKVELKQEGKSIQPVQKIKLQKKAKIGDNLIDTAGKTKGIDFKDHLTSDGKGNFLFFHHPKADREWVGDKVKPTLDKNAATADKRTIPVSYYYTTPNFKEPVIGETGEVKVVRIPENRVYPLNSDPMGYLDKAEKNFKAKYPNRAFDAPMQADYVNQLATKDGYKVMVGEWEFKGSKSGTKKILARAEAQVPHLFEEKVQDVVLPKYPIGKEVSTEAESVVMESSDVLKKEILNWSKEEYKGKFNPFDAYMTQWGLKEFVNKYPQYLDELPSDLKAKFSALQKAGELKFHKGKSVLNTYINSLVEDGVLEEFTAEEIAEDLEEFGYSVEDVQGAIDKIIEPKKEVKVGKTTKDKKVKVEHKITEHSEGLMREVMDLQLTKDEVTKLVEENNLDELKSLLMDRDSSSKMNDSTYLALLSEVAISYGKKGDLTTATKLWDMFAEKSSQAGKALRMIRFISDNPIVATRMVVARLNQQVNEKLKALDVNGKPISKNISDGWDKLKDVAKNIGVRITDSDTFNTTLDKIVAKIEKKGVSFTKSMSKANSNIDKLFNDFKSNSPKFQKVSEKIKFQNINVLTPREKRLALSIAKELINTGKVDSIDDVIEMVNSKFKDNLDREIPASDLIDIRNEIKKIPLKAAIKDSKKEIKNIIKEHTSKKDELKRSLSQKLIDKLGIDGKEAKEIEDLFNEVFENELKGEIQKKLVEAFGKSLVPKPELTAEKAMDNVVDAINMGAFNDDFYKTLAANKLGVPVLSEAQQQRINDFADAIQELPEGSSLRRRALKDMQTYINNVKDKSVGEKMANLAMELFYTNTLSGLSTVSRALKGGAITASAEVVATSLQTMFKNPVMGSKAVMAAIKAMMGGVKRYGITSYHQVLKDGFEDTEFFEVNPGYKTKLDQIIDNSYNELIASGESVPKKAFEVFAKTFFTIPKVVYRFIIANDAMMRVGLKEFATYIEIYNNELMASNGEAVIFSEINKKASLDNASIEKAKIDVAKEKEHLLKKGVKLPGNYEQVRLQEFIDTNREQHYSDVNTNSLEWAKSALLMNEPTGMLGALYDNISSGLTVKESDANAVKFAKLAGKFMGFPFLRVATNFINMSMKVTPLLSALNKGVWEKQNQIRLNSQDPLVNAKAKRELFDRNMKHWGAMGMYFVGTLLMFDEDEDSEDIEVLGIPTFLPNKLKLNENFPVQFTAGGTGDYYSDQTLSKDYKTNSFRVKKPNGEWSDWYSYIDNPFGALFAMFGIASDAVRIKKARKEQTGKIPDDFGTQQVMVFSTLNGALNFMTEQSYSQGIKNMSSLFTSDNKTEEFAKMISRPVKGLVHPNFYKQLSQQVDAYSGEGARGVSYSDDLLKTVSEVITRDVPLVEDISNNNDYDLFGNEIIKKFEIPLVPDYLLDMIKENRDYRENDKAWKIIYEHDAYYVRMKKRVDKELYKKVKLATGEDISYSDFESAYRKIHGKLLKEEFLELHKRGITDATGRKVKGEDWDNTNVHKAMGKAGRNATKKAKVDIVRYFK